MKTKHEYQIGDLFYPTSYAEPIKHTVIGLGDLDTIYGQSARLKRFDKVVPFHISEIAPWNTRPKAAKGARLCPRGTEIQTLIFSKDNFTQDQAKDWAWEHDFNAGIDEKENTYRMRQQHPSKFKDGTFRTIDITDGIKAVIGCPIAKAGTGAQITKADIVENARFKNKNGDIFIVDKVYPNETFGTAVESSIEGGKKGNYRDSLEDFVAFMNEEGATKIAGSGAYWIAIQPTKIAERGGKVDDFEFYDGGDGVEYEIWRHKESRHLYRVPITRGEDSGSGESNIERDFSSAQRIAARGGKVPPKYWSVGIDMGEEQGTMTIKSGFKTKESAEQYADLVRKNPRKEGVYYDFEKVFVDTADWEIESGNTAAPGGKISPQEVRFKYKGKNISFKFTPEESDWWMGFHDQGYEFDVHYDEDYGQISVYEVIDGNTNTSKSVYNKKIAARGIRLVNEDEYRARLRTLIDELTDIGIDLDGEEETIVAGLRLELEDEIDKEQDFSELKKAVSYIILVYIESWEEDLPKKERNLIAGSINKFQTGKAARGAKTPQAMGKDRKYTSDQPHEKRYKLKRKSRVLRYKKS